MAQLWDDVLFPAFREKVRGTYYGVITQDFLDEEFYYIACSAISAFKFPKISTAYETIYANRDEDNDNTLLLADEEDEDAIPHGRFLNDLGPAEIEVILEWMLVYWCKKQLDNADNFDDYYTDANIKSYSRANMIEKTNKMLEQHRNDAKDAESRYYRINANRRPSMGDINEDV